MTLDRETKIKDAASLAIKECLKARSKWKQFNSTHEGYAVVLEELDEAWDAIKANDRDHAVQEMIQVAAMAIAFVAELSPPL